MATTQSCTRQTREHVRGRRSYHQIGVFLGQPRGEIDDLEGLFKAIAAAGADGMELDSWKLDLARATTPEGALIYAEELMELAKGFDLSIFSIAAHLQGQALGDEPSVKTLQFMGGAPVDAYLEWRETNRAPRGNPYYVPDNVANLMREKATEDLKAIGRLAFHLGILQDRNVPISGFTGAPADLWASWFPFPPEPTTIGGNVGEGGVSIFDWDSGKAADEQETHLDRAYALLLERFGPVWKFYQEYPQEQNAPEGHPGILFGLEAHPTEIAMGDFASAWEFIKRVHGAGFTNVGFNFDNSHQEWQDVDGIAFIHEFGKWIWSVHIKGVAVRSRRSGYTRAGRLGGYTKFGNWQRTMDFVLACSSQDDCDEGAIIIALNQVGFVGALTIELEDNDVKLIPALASTIEQIAELDLEPSAGAFDAAFKA